jgi:phosphoribosyl 1,2-cyclic phosphate phosphodiesterase
MFNENLTVTVLGCGSSNGVPSLKYGWGNCDKNNPKNHRSRSSIMIETKTTSLLVDMSPDLRQQLLDSKLNPNVDAVFFTHEHYDHVNGINELRPVFFEDHQVLQIYSSSDVIQKIRKMFYYLFEDSEQDIYKPYIATNEINDSFSIGDIDGVCFEQSHGYSKTLGIRVGDFAYCTDVVELSRESFEKLRGIDTWIVDCLSLDPRPTHAHLTTVLEWVEELKPKMTFLTHMGITMDYDSLVQTLPANVRPAYDGMKIMFDCTAGSCKC